MAELILVVSNLPILFRFKIIRAFIARIIQNVDGRKIDDYMLKKSGAMLLIMSRPFS